MALAAGCRAAKPQAEVYERVSVSDTLEAVALPADSLWLEALFRCDSAGQISMHDVSEGKGGRISSTLSFDGGRLRYKAVAGKDTVYVRSRRVERASVRIETRTAWRDREPPWYSRAAGYCGYILWAAAAAYIIYRIAKRK
jgi:hypothetical protein